MKIVICTGGFDPLHSGHIAFFKEAKTLGDYLVVGLNSDAWLTRKKGRPFMPWQERFSVVSNLSIVDEVVSFNDDDGSAIDAIRKVLLNSNTGDQIIFANGGDRTKDNIPEMSISDARLSFVFGVGGENKMNSSSWILQEWKSPKTERPWGYYRVLHDVVGCKVKELTVEPGQRLSMQRHSKRKEHWLVSEGKCIVNSMTTNGYYLPPRELVKHDALDIDYDQWHQLTNPFDQPCRIVEIQYGIDCIEEDIERKS